MATSHLASTLLPQAADEPAAAPVPVTESDYVTLPGGGRMPLLGLGTYKIERADQVTAALAAGYRHLDCAPAYGNEAAVGEAVAAFLSEHGPDSRSQLWITSKIWNDAHRPDAARASVARSLADLGVDYLDLLLVHWPIAWVPGTQDPDPGVTMAETWAALEGLVAEGLVRHLGVSNFGLPAVEEVLGFAKVRPVVNQVELHPLLAQRKLVGVCARRGVRCVAYSPLGHSRPDLLDHPTVKEVAAQAGRTPAQVLLRWGVQRGCPVVAKAGGAGHLAENIEGLHAWRLSWDQKAALDAMDEGRRLAIPPFYTFPTGEEGGGAAKPSQLLL